MSTTETKAAPAAMHTRYGPLFRRLFRHFFEPVRFPDEAQALLEDLARRGTIVYVMRSAGILNFLYFNWAFARRGLPLARAVLGLSTFLYRPLVLILRRRTARGAEAVLQSARAGEASMVFLRRPSVLRSRGSSTDDPFAALVALQRTTDRPIYLVPQLLIFKRAPSRLRPGVTDVVLGSAEVPGRIHAFTSFLFNYKRSVVKVGMPIDLSEVVRAETGVPDEILARKVRGSLGVGLARELRSVVGPRLKSQRRMIDETLRDRALRAELVREAEASSRDLAVVEEEARRCLREISARYSPAWIDGANAVARWLFNRLYDGIDIDEEGLRAAAEASKQAPIVICPTHRSHIDYLLVSHVLVERGVTPPLVAAGANLSFWPLGPIFRRTGAFFIRRSFKGQRVYAASLSAYIRKVCRDGYTQEFYPEGGRTRTGRLLQPKFGLISIEVDAWIAGARDDLCFVPTAIDYEKIIEARAYARELAGGEKRREDIRGLLKTPAVLLSRWGRVHLQVAPPISLAALAKERGFDRSSFRRDERKALIRALAHRIARGMGDVQTITASSLTAAGLLHPFGPVLRSSELEARIRLLRKLAEAKRARFSKAMSIAPSDPTIPGPIREALAGFEADKAVKTFEQDGERAFRVEAHARSALDFYKNNIVHHFTEEAIVAASLLALGGATTRAKLTEPIGWLSRLLKNELSFRTDVSMDATIDEALERLDALGLLVREAESVRIREGQEPGMRLLRGQLADLIEAFRLLATTLDELSGGPMDRKRLVERCFVRGKEALDSGVIQGAEALSRPTFESAIAWLVEQGHLVPEGEKRLGLSEEWKPREPRQAFVDRLDRFLADGPA
ncbi:1-acyl-sn-glycerol-3-phosphate acyltransferase [Vulgatibacter incomptus]|uniref:Glycerol-3-phosphate acyltransferase n=1 Tax=Vulgatibacter incomptus TaxID=1391653 RepID=A0A0K1P934_9BACT|nr:1-acyl-sn-glycerol-3-phosphate acyltransferase [Vulgatibacter incomptus]AKU89926.1 Glycerol-3-phosphate acyltransferase [Vulgatibacter incomptus]